MKGRRLGGAFKGARVPGPCRSAPLHHRWPFGDRSAARRLAFLEAIHRTYPQAEWPYSILHKLRASQAQVKRRDASVLPADLKRVYRAPNRAEALLELKRFGRTAIPGHCFLVERLGGFASVLRRPRAFVAPSGAQPDQAVLPGATQAYQGVGPQVSQSQGHLQARLSGGRTEEGEVRPEAAWFC